jgi:hypothetical protein
MTEHLFIGGPNDGDMRRVETYPTLMMRGEDCKVHEYRKEYLGAPGRTWVVYVSIGMTLEKAMDSLIENYKPQKP